MFTGWHHTNIIVSDFDRSLEFYTDVLGLTIAAQTEIDDAEFSRGVAIPGTKVRAAFLAVPNCSAVIEIFQYMSSDSKPIPEDALPSDIGVGHICFQVENIDETYAALSAKGVKFTTTPVTISESHPDVGGVRFCYFSDPDGTTLEILQTP
ncbi:MAG: VOC family protein [Lentisphaeria bacterium]|jgi:catechol 2,3-dioxygenase-like lactoylglutathione lyase family enzyme|tara:strand:+ start:260 stop:712 length:453 start_codon:yes stop_codon:yes gene_type:complete